MTKALDAATAERIWDYQLRPYLAEYWFERPAELSRLDADVRTLIAELAGGAAPGRVPAQDGRTQPGRGRRAGPHDRRDTERRRTVQGDRPADTDRHPRLLRSPAGPLC